MNNIDPDTLLERVNKTALLRDALLSLVVHVLLIGLTSFGLYRAWAVWGVHKPSTIEAMQREADKQAAAEARKAAAEQKAMDADRKAMEEADAKKAAEAAGGGAAASAKKVVEEAEKKAEKAGAASPRRGPLEDEIDTSKPTADLGAIDL